MVEDLHQKKMSTWVTAVSRARLRRQPTPMRGRADSRQTTLSTVVTSSEGSSPFNLKEDTGLYPHSKALRSLGASPTSTAGGQEEKGQGTKASVGLQNRLGIPVVLFPEISHIGYLERMNL